jgi:hypothetical protein
MPIRENSLFIPALLGLTYAEFEAAKREWALEFGAATSIVVQADNLAASISSIVKGIPTLGDRKRANTTLPRRVGLDYAPHAIERQTLEHGLGARLEAVEHDVVEKALREGVDELGDSDLLPLLHAFACSGRMALSPDGLLIFDAATCIVDRLAKSRPAGPRLSEVMARLLAQIENKLGLTNRHQAWKHSRNAAKALRVTRKQQRSGWRSCRLTGGTSWSVWPSTIPGNSSQALLPKRQCGRSHRSKKTSVFSQHLVSRSQPA